MQRRAVKTQYDVMVETEERRHVYLASLHCGGKIMSIVHTYHYIELTLHWYCLYMYEYVSKCPLPIYCSVDELNRMTR